MRHLLLALVFSVVASSAAAQEVEKAADLLQPLAFLVGTWRGTSSGQPGEGTAEREYTRTLSGRFIHVRNRSVYPPQARNPKGEVHEDVGFLGFDRVRRRFVLRQFHVEGFVNQYVSETVPAASGSWVFTSEAIENIPAGWRARETYTVKSSDELEEVFELAAPGKEFEVYTRVRLTRVAASQGDVADLIAIQHQLAKAWVAGDRATLEPLFAADWHLTSSNGTRNSRAAVFAEVFDTKVHRIVAATIDEIQVRMAGRDAAVVTGRTRASGDYAGRPYDVTIRFTDVWERRSGGWQVVASHASNIGDPQRRN